jgi:hypothetical protein
MQKPSESSVAVKTRKRSPSLEGAGSSRKKRKTAPVAPLPKGVFSTMSYFMPAEHEDLDSGMQVDGDDIHAEDHVEGHPTIDASALTPITMPPSPERDASAPTALASALSSIPDQSCEQPVAKPVSRGATSYTRQVEDAAAEATHAASGNNNQSSAPKPAAEATPPTVGCAFEEPPTENANLVDMAHSSAAISGGVPSPPARSSSVNELIEPVYKLSIIQNQPESASDNVAAAVAPQEQLVGPVGPSSQPDQDLACAAMDGPGQDNLVVDSESLEQGDMEVNAGGEQPEEIPGDTMDSTIDDLLAPVKGHDPKFNTGPTAVKKKKKRRASRKGANPKIPTKDRITKDEPAQGTLEENKDKASQPIMHTVPRRSLPSKWYCNRKVGALR